MVEQRLGFRDVEFKVYASFSLAVILGVPDSGVADDASALIAGIHEELIATFDICPVPMNSPAIILKYPRIVNEPSKVIDRDFDVPTIDGERLPALLGDSV